MSMNDVVVYAKHYCPYCARAKSLLRDKGVEFKEIEVAFDPDLQSEMIATSGRRTVPQIFIDGRHIGGYDDLAALNRSGELDEILAARQETALAA
jgi:GrxC family glutaredoxin